MDPGQLVRGVLFALSLGVVAVMGVGVDEAARMAGIDLPEAVEPAPRGLARADSEGGAGTAGAQQAPPASAAAAIRKVEYPVGKQSHQCALFVPQDTPGPYPVLVLLDYWVSNKQAVRQWQSAAQRAGWLVVSTKHVYRGSSDASDRAEYQSLLRHLASTHPIDRSQVAITGFSAAGVGAYAMALRNADIFTGAIPQGAHMAAWKRQTHFTRTPLRFYLFAAQSDFNVSHSQSLGAAMRHEGYRVGEGTGPGAHRSMETEEQLAALSWFARKR